MLRHLAETLEAVEASGIARRTAETIVAGLDVAWVSVNDVTGSVVEAGGARQGAPDVTVPLLAGGVAVGSIECGPRRGGWAAGDLDLLNLLARHAALALNGADLTVALARQVEDLTASRERLVRAEDEVRRQIERDLHDGIQQQLVVLLGKLGMLKSLVDAESLEGRLAAQSHEQAQRSLDELRDLVRGIHPPLLSDAGVAAAVQAQVDLLPAQVSVDIDPRLQGIRFPAEVETAAYYVVCEATTNVLKHASASRTRVVLSPVAPDGLQVAVVDDGCGFDTNRTGSGLPGLRDRVEAVGGTLSVTSTPGVGTTVVATFATQVAADV